MISAVSLMAPATSSHKDGKKLQLFPVSYFLHESEIDNDSHGNEYVFRKSQKERFLAKRKKERCNKISTAFYGALVTRNQGSSSTCFQCTYTYSRE
jgi:hypothetical protein